MLHQGGKLVSKQLGGLLAYALKWQHPGDASSKLSLPSADKDLDKWTPVLILRSSRHLKVHWQPKAA
jgi:hypothetical protein